MEYMGLEVKGFVIHDKDETTELEPTYKNEETYNDYCVKNRSRIVDECYYFSDGKFHAVFE